MGRGSDGLGHASRPPATFGLSIEEFFQIYANFPKLIDYLIEKHKTSCDFGRTGIIVMEREIARTAVPVVIHVF
jgi:hypothetical protein